MTTKEELLEVENNKLREELRAIKAKAHEIAPDQIVVKKDYLSWLEGNLAAKYYEIFKETTE